MYQSAGLAKLQAALANRKYSYGGQLPSDVENQSKTQNFGNMVGGGIERMQRIFGNSSGGSDGGIRTTEYATTTSDGNGGSGIQRFQAFARSTSSPTTKTWSSTSDDSTLLNAPQIPTYDNSSNLNVPKQQNYQDVNYKEMIPYLEKWDDRNFDRNAAYAGITALSNAFGKTGGFSTVFGSYQPR